MATEIAKAYVQIVPTTKGIKGALESELGGAGESAGNKAGGSFASGMGKAIAGSAAALGAAVGTATAAISKSISSTAEYGDNIDKMSQKMGLSAEAFQEWDFIMQHSGTTIEAMQSSMKTLATAAESGSDAFDQLGISQEEIANMSQQDLFEATISALQNVSSETERTYLAGKLLGRGATELGPLLNTSAEDVEAMRQQVHDLGGIMSNEAVAASASYQDSMQNLQTSISGIAKGMAGDLLPSATLAIDGLTDLFTGNGGGVEKIKEGVQGIVDTIVGMAPEFINTLTVIVGALIEALPDALPGIIDAVVDFTVAVAPQLVEAGITLFLSLIGALPEIAVKIAGAVPEIIKAIVNGFKGKWSDIKQSGVDMFEKIKTALIDNAVKMKDAAKEIVEKLKTAITDKMKDIGNIGKNIVDGVWNGISGAWQTFYNNVAGFFGGIVDSVKNLLGIHSPSKVFSEIGGYMAEGLDVGFQHEMESVKRDVTDDINGIVGGIGKISAGANVNVTAANNADSFDRVISAINDRAMEVKVYLDSREIRSGQQRLARAMG